MTESKGRKSESRAGPIEVKLPGFLVKKEIGLGQLIKRTTYAVGMVPCASCEKRAAILDRWMFFSRYR
jgi:hypothetical protein